MAAGIELKGASEAIKMFQGMQERAVHGNRFFARAAMRMWRDVIDHFRQQSSPEGKWQPWSPAYAARRKAGRGGNMILQDTGVLRTSIQWRGEANNARVFTNMEYAPAHQYGSKDRNVPKREFMWLANRTREDIMTDYRNFIIGGL